MEPARRPTQGGARVTARGQRQLAVTTRAGRETERCQCPAPPSPSQMRSRLLGQAGQVPSWPSRDMRSAPRL
eukprot:3361814-Rhodomonas_salina.1